MLIPILVTVFVIVFIDFVNRWRRNRRLPNIPDVTSLPLVGTLLALSSFQPDNLHLKFQEYVDRFGKTFRSHLLNTLVVVTADPRYIEELLRSSRHTHKHVLYMLLQSWLGNGLLLSHGSKWQAMRKILTPTFHFKILEDFIEVFDKQSTTMIEKIREFADGQTIVDIYPHMGLLTMDIIGETAMGVQIDAQLNSKSDFVQAVNDVTNILATRFVRPHLAFRNLYRLLTPDMYRKQTDGIATLHNFTNNIIEERRKSLRANGTMDNDEDDENNDLGIKKRLALLDVLLRATTSDGERLSDEQIRDEVNTFMFEGHDTTTSATSFCLYLLSRHPSIQEKLFNEIKSYFGDDLSRPITYQDLQELSYLNAVIKESLRIYPPIPAIGRWLKEDCELVDVTLPAGTNVIILIWTLLRDPSIFHEPETFRPERHLEDNKRANAFSNIPFSAGPRNCIGQRFALFEMKVIVIKLLRHYELLPMGDVVQPSIKIILRSKTGINMGLKPRQY